MNKLTHLIKRQNMPTQPYPECHGGEGELSWTDVSANLPSERKLQWLHDHTLEPGVSIGIHAHHTDEEYYYVLSGSGIMTLDGEEQPIETGDLSAIYPGGTHGIKNTSNKVMRLLVISIHREET